MNKSLSSGPAVLRARARRLWSRGVTAVEFALVAPLAIIVIFLGLEMGIATWGDASLEVAAGKITRIGQLGIETGKTCEETVNEILQHYVGRWVSDPSKLRVDVSVYVPGSPVVLPDVDDEEYAPVCDSGDRGDMVVYRVGFDRPSFTGIMGFINMELMRFERTVIIQNEP